MWYLFGLWQLGPFGMELPVEGFLCFFAPRWLKPRFRGPMVLRVGPEGSVSLSG